MKIKISFFITGFLFFNAVAQNNEYEITEGQYKGQKATFIKSQELTTEFIENSTAYNILLARFAKLPNDQKNQITKALEQSTEKDPKIKLFNALPANIKGPVSFCLINEKKHYIDAAFLKPTNL